jgi:hypothetical protein
MNHPFISDLSDKSTEDLQKALADLTSKLNFAYRMQNQPMIQQLQLVLSSYREEHNRRMDALYNKQNVQNQIKISKES